MFERRIKLQGVKNARQLGHLTAADSRIKESCLIRSAHLGRMSQDDVELLKDKYRLTKVIDLRRDQEAKERPDRFKANYDYIRIPVFNDVLLGISHDKESEQEVQYKASDLKKLYKYMVLDRTCRKNIAEVLNIIIDHDYDSGSILWHCTEGKDRCGLISAFVLFMLGFSYDDVIEDYLITNETNKAKTKRMYRMMKKMGKSEEEAIDISELYLAKKEYFDAAYDAIISKYKSIDNYLINALELDVIDIKRFKDKVLVA